MPRTNGKHRVYVYFNGYDVKGSPFIMKVGSKGKSGKTRSNQSHDNRYRSESPSMHYTTTTTSSSANTSSGKRNDFRTAKKEMYAEENRRSYSPAQYSPPRNAEVSLFFYLLKDQLIELNS